jgi:hypothetical protein
MVPHAPYANLKRAASVSRKVRFVISWCEVPMHKTLTLDFVITAAAVAVVVGCSSPTSSSPTGDNSTETGSPVPPPRYTRASPAR